MNFREDFLRGYLLTPAGPRQRTFAQWSLENTVDSGLRANQQQLEVLRSNMKSVFQTGVERLAAAQAESGKLLREEIRYQSENIIESFDRGSSSIVSAVQRGCEYLGGELCEIRWAIERQTDVSRQVLQILLDSLDNSSRQYWEQGVRCYETQEDDIAKERFQRALDANRTNYFAYQYLGFIAVRQEQPAEAVRLFDLARKFANTTYHQAIALSHLARAHHANGQAAKAVEAAQAAARLEPNVGRFHYEAAVYLARTRATRETLKSLQRAIETDWSYWSISAVDAQLDSMRDEADDLLLSLRAEQGDLALSQLSQLRSALEDLKAMGLTAAADECLSALGSCEERYKEGTVFAYRDARSRAAEGRQKAFERALRDLNVRCIENRRALDRAQQASQQAARECEARVSRLEADARSVGSRYKKWSNTGCLAVLAIPVGAMASHMTGLVIESNGGSYEHTLKFGALITGLLILLLLGANPLRKLLFATIPAANFRSRLPLMRRECEESKHQLDKNLAQEIRRLDLEHANLQTLIDRCRAMLST